ncbi:hypothetical protein ACIA6C_32285 [Streptomyces sp. NPDC051578]|uniref:hypothetical protein n=1 Tax=Streptomyces sp. NPDC051578 TaxID=3365662 RepID=UPI00379FA8AE
MLRAVPGKRSSPQLRRTGWFRTALLPTLDLLAQTIAEWKALGHSGPVAAVCSLEDDPRMYSLGARTTTSAPRLALWHGRGSVTVYATYASLPVLIEAHEGTYGLPMDA